MDHTKAKKLRKRILITLFVIFNIGIVLWTALSEFADRRNAAKLRSIQIRWGMIIPAVLCFALAISVESLKYSAIIKKTTGKGNLRLAFSTVILGRYYDNITPFGAGGQPFQIYHLKQHGLNTAQSAAVPIAGFISTQFGFIILAVGAFTFRIISNFFKGDIQNVIKISSYVGLLCYSAVPILILIFAFFPKAASKIISWFVRLMGKLHIVKDTDSKIESLYSTMNDYAVSFRQVIRSGGLCVMLLTLSFVYQFALNCIPFFLIHAFGGSMGFFECLVTTVSIFCAITIIPTPGNSVAAEGSFFAVFSTLTEGYVFWAMLSWRFFSFYIFIIAGALIYAKRYLLKKRLSR